MTTQRQREERCYSAAKLRRQQIQVLSTLSSVSTALTAEQIAGLGGLRLNSVSTRMKVLHENGWVRIAGTTEDRYSKRLYRITHDGRALLTGLGI